jgi:hypothetical protein
MVEEKKEKSKWKREKDMGGHGDVNVTRHGGGDHFLTLGP